MSRSHPARELAGTDFHNSAVAAAGGFVVVAEGSASWALSRHAEARDGEVAATGPGAGRNSSDT